MYVCFNKIENDSQVNMQPNLEYKQALSCY